MFDRLVALNVRAPFFLVQQLLPVMCKGSNVILLSSLATPASSGSFAAYASTKGAVETMVRHLAHDLGPRGIRVNAIAPGIVETDMHNLTKTDASREMAFGMQALKRMAPNDIGSVVPFLASEAAGRVTGNILAVDGGALL